MGRTPVISEAFVLAAMSALFYAVAFSYQTGYASYFSLPPLLLTPSLGLVFKVALPAGAIFLSCFLLADIVYPLIPKNGRAVAVWIAWLGVVFVAMGLKGGVVVAAIVFVLIGAARLAERLIHGHWSSESRLERIVDRLAASPLAHIYIAVGAAPLRIVLLALLIVALAEVSGRWVASVEEDFLVLDGVAGYVVAGMDEELLILAGYQTDTKTLTGSYLVMRLSEQHPWLLVRQHVGRLQEPSLSSK